MFALEGLIRDGATKFAHYQSGGVVERLASGDVVFCRKTQKYFLRDPPPDE